MLNQVWSTVRRWRTYVVNIVLALLFIMPEVLNSPEVLAVIPADYQRWFLVGAFLVNILMRPWPAVLPTDTEVQVKKAIKRANGPATVEVKAGGETKVVYNAPHNP